MNVLQMDMFGDCAGLMSPPEPPKSAERHEKRDYSAKIKKLMVLHANAKLDLVIDGQVERSVEQIDEDIGTEEFLRMCARAAARKGQSEEEIAAKLELWRSHINKCEQTAEAAGWHSDGRMTEEVVKWLHVKMLDDNLAVLQSKDVKAEALDEKGWVIEWIWATDTVNPIGRRFSYGTQSAQAVPFSFVNCCLVAQVSPEALRAELIQLSFVRDAILLLGKARQDELPPLRQKVYYRGVLKNEDEADIPDHTVYQFGW